MKKSLILLAAFCFGLYSNACTTFFINKNGQMLFGRNYDWITDAGMVCTNLKGLFKTSMKTEDGEPISWVSKYGSVTFNQYGKEFPTGGMNESGLVVELMWLDETRYPAPDKRPSIGVLQWIQYQLDNCSSIEEVIATDKILRIASIGTTPLHYLVADANGNAATIEFLDGKMVAHKGSDLKQPVLTNSIYKESVRAYENSITQGQKVSFAYGNNSIDRFKEACSMIRKLNEAPTTGSIIDYAFSILDAVSQGSSTKWSIVYDIKNKVIRFKTNRFTDVKSVSFGGVDFKCSARSKTWNMNQKAGGEIGSKMEDFTQEINQKLVQTSFTESKQYISVSDAVQEKVWIYPKSINCQ